MAVVGDGVLAVSEGVPELDRVIAGSGDDLSVVGRERDGKNVLVVANESAGGGTGGELPETQSLVPRGRQSVGAVGGDDLHCVSQYQPTITFDTGCSSQNSGSRHTQSETM